MKRAGNVAIVFVMTALALRATAASQNEPLPVEPADLESRRDLVGREVVVDDHVTYYIPRTGSLPDELQLKRTDVSFLVPRRLRPASGSRLSSVQVRGVVRQEGTRIVCDVISLKAMPGDLDRVAEGLAGASTKDFETRRAWARWAERRARDFKDDALMKRARQLETEALRIEADFRRQAVDAPREWLAMARDARQRGIAEPEPSALAHRALRARLAAVPDGDSAELKATVEAIESFFPRAPLDRDSARTDLTPWEAAYRDDPAATYRKVPAEIAKALDRRLWADATERRMAAEPTGDLAAAIALAEQARTQLPEKPNLPPALLDQAAKRARQSLATARLADARALAKVFTDVLHQPDQAQAVLREWLKIQADRLSTTDAEGPLALAPLYEELLSDRVTAIELLRKAWRIDPSSPEIADAFRTRGFHKEKDDWVELAPESQPGGIRPPATAGRGPAPLATKGLKGLTPDEVRAKLGSRPDRVNFVGSNGQLIEQWIYLLDTKLIRYVNFLHTPGDFKPRAIADYQLPRFLAKGGPSPSH